ncbi:MAG: GH116 family glycosyl hydrolase [Planctomycetota bacterium]
MAESSIPYKKDDVFAVGPQPTYTGRRIDEIAFPLGGIGTGTISLGGWGQLRDFEIRNRPAKGFDVPYTFFALRAEGPDGEFVARILQGPKGGDFSRGGHSAAHGTVDGLPHFRHVAFRGEYPVATVELSDPDVPVDVTLEAFNPMIPLEADDSGIPVAILRYHLTNKTDRELSITAFGSLTNVIGPDEGRTNEARAEGALGGLFLTNESLGADSPAFGSMALASPLGGSAWRHTAGERFLRLNKLWEVLSGQVEFPPDDADSDTGMIATELTLEPGGTAVVPFFITWHFPTFEHWESDEHGHRATWKNYYATQWADAWDVAEYVAGQFDRLHRETKRFHDALFESTLPAHVLDAVSSQISTIRTTTCLRLTDGTFYGFEGCNDDSGCCQGSCTHVWNYAQALPHLFPGLQRSMAEAHFEYSMSDDGFVQFRMPLPPGTRAQAGFLPAADGQMGLVMQVYREWQLGAGDDWLRRVWPGAKRALEFAWTYWDADRDGVMENAQHNTYDQEFWGPNTMTGSLYLGALRAGEEMARAVGDDEAADIYRDLFESGSAWADEHLWNGEYYEQHVNPDGNDVWPEPYKSRIDRGNDDRFRDWPRWQYGRGCLSDQLIGQWLATRFGLGDLYDREHVRRALRSVVQYNWRADLTGHPCTLRIYALNEEAGLLIASWPRGERPGNPFWFCDEVWCGIEYQVAAHLVDEGLVEEGLAIVKGVRDRYRGDRRNPWDEIECGHHYARSMASYALLGALAGFRYSAPHRTVRIEPRVFESAFRCFFSVADGWGVIGQTIGEEEATLSVRVDAGRLTLARIETPLAAADATAAVTLGGTPLAATVEPGAVLLEPPATIAAGQALEIALRC